MHKLALRMGRTVSELRSTLTVDELAHWYAFDRMSPIGDERADYSFALLTKATVEAAGAKPKRGGLWKLEDFLLFRLFKADPSKLTPLQAMRGWFGGAVKRKEKRDG